MRIRLRYCTLRFIDGYAATAVVNGAPLDGATSMTITTTAGVIPLGTRFTVVGANEIFTITAVSGSPNTTDITFTPAMATAKGLPENGAAITIQGRCLAVKIGDGNITYDTARNIEYERDRGHLDAVVEGDDEPVAFNLDLIYEWLASSVGATIPTPKEVLKRRGAAADWVTAGANPCEPYAIKIEVDYQPPCAAEHEITILPEARAESINHDLQNATITVRGRCKTKDIVPFRRSF